MPDIAMCGATNCPLSRQCRRHPESGTTPDPVAQAWQSWPGGVECAGWWAVAGAGLFRGEGKAEEAANA